MQHVLDMYIQSTIAQRRGSNEGKGGRERGREREERERERPRVGARTAERGMVGLLEAAVEIADAEVRLSSALSSRPGPLVFAFGVCCIVIDRWIDGWMDRSIDREMDRDRDREV